MRPSRPGYVPQDLPDEVDGTLERLLSLRPEALPTLGLAECYLASTPVRISNQCGIASLVLQLVLNRLGLPASAVAVLLDVPQPGGGTTRYGNEDPHMTKDGLIVGHVGLVGDDYFVDATAAQFPEIRRGGARTVGGTLQGQQEEILRAGALIPIRLLDGTPVTYRLYPEGSADPILDPMMESGGEQGLDDIARLANNLLIAFCKTMTDEPFLSRIRSLTAPRYTQLVGRVNDMIGREITTDENGWMVVQSADPAWMATPLR